jgi:hypothetical protein
MDLGDNILDVKHLAILSAFLKLKDSFLQMVVRREYSDDHFDVLSNGFLEFKHGIDEFLCIVFNRVLDGLHFEWDSF